MWIFTGASLVWSCWMSVFSATNSTCEMSASIMRLTAFRPAPPTPTTRIMAMYAPRSGTRWRRGGGSGSGSSFGRGSSAFGSGARSGRLTGSGGGGGGGGGAGSSHSGTCSTVFSGGSTGFAFAGLGAGGGAASTGAACCSATGSGSWPSFSACRWAASVARKSSASGPSRMLARLRAIEHLLRQIAVRLGGAATGVVFQDGSALHGRLRIANRLADLRVEDEIAEVLLQDLDRLPRVQRPAVVHRREDPLDPDLRVQVLADHRKCVFELDESAQREVLALHRDDHAVRRDECVDRQQAERRRRVDQDVVVRVPDGRERLLQRALAADHAGQRELGAGEVDRRDRDVDLTMLDHFLDRQPVHQHVEHRALDRVRVQALTHRQVALRIEVTEQHLEVLLGERDAEVERRRRLGDAAFLIGKRDHAAHRRPFGRFGPDSRSRKQACKPHRAPFFALMLAIPLRKTLDFSRCRIAPLPSERNVRPREDEPFTEGGARAPSPS